MDIEIQKSSRKKQRNILSTSTDSEKQKGDMNPNKNKIKTRKKNKGIKNSKYIQIKRQINPFFKNTHTKMKLIPFHGSRSIRGLEISSNQ